MYVELPCSQKEKWQANNAATISLGIYRETRYRTTYQVFRPPTPLRT